MVLLHFFLKSFNLSPPSSYELPCHVESMQSMSVVGSLLIGLVKSYNPVVGVFLLQTMRGYHQASELSGNEGEWEQEIMVEQGENERLFSRLLLVV